MKRNKRPIPYPWPSSAYRDEYRRLRQLGHSPNWSRELIRKANREVRMFPVKGERCEARTRKGIPCKAPAQLNGRCRNHGGLSTGPRTEAGKKKALAAIGQKPWTWSPHPPHIQARIKQREKEHAERLALRARARVMESEKRQ